MIDLTGVTKVFRVGSVDVHALAGVSLTVARASWLAIMGPSGSGKSTLMHIIGCLSKPTAGTYRLNGIQVEGMSEDELAAVRSEQLGFVFQTFNLLPRRTALQQVMLPMQYRHTRSPVPPAERERRAREVLEQVGLGDRLNHLPTELSGGQRQKVAIARALVNNPAIILADEPTGNLDSRSGEDIMGVFRRLHREDGLTLVVVTHDAEIAAATQRIVRLLDGRIVEDTGR